MLETDKKSFKYTYSARQQEEIRQIREKYTTNLAKQKEEDKMERIRQLDNSVAHKATASSLASGIIGTLLFGTGMSCFLVWNMAIPGIALGLVGMAGIILAHPIYTYVSKAVTEKVRPEILSLTEELMK